MISKTITEAVLRNSSGGELDRQEMKEFAGYFSLPTTLYPSLAPGDTITVEQRQEEVE